MKSNNLSYYAILKDIYNDAWRINKLYFIGVVLLFPVVLFIITIFKIIVFLDRLNKKV